VVDDGTGLKKVQVKTTTAVSEYGVFAVSLCTNGGNQSFRGTKHFDPTSCDLLYVLTDDWSRYLIPTSIISARRSLNLGRRLEPYRIGGR
jgi:hypothetical protein